MILITADETAAIPRPISLTLTCDGEHGMFPVQQTIVGEFTAAYSAMTRAGWKQSQISAGRLFLCPQCARKVKVGGR